MARQQTPWRGISFFHGTPLLLLLVDCSSFLHPEAVGCGSQLIVFVVFVVRQQAITTMAIAACCNQVDCAVFYLMEGHRYHGPVSFAPGSMKFAAHGLQVDCGFLGKATEGHQYHGQIGFFTWKRSFNCVFFVFLVAREQNAIATCLAGFFTQHGCHRLYAFLF